uniref:Uncharacterized protein n=1 Tax=Mola mola TaxID=94237 RepID=A0A3Q3X0I4_MOLML
MNIYAPKADLPGFCFVEVSNEITQFGNSCVVLGGDFNNVKNPKVDKTYTWGITRPSQARKAIDTLEGELDLVDVWRYFYTSDKEFTFYSYPHISYLRIDYFLISKSLLSITEPTTIGTILSSDHVPVGLSQRLGQLSKLRPIRWRFNSSLLKDEQSEFIKSEILHYWLNNEGSVTLANVTTDGSPNLTGKNQEVIFLHCIIHQEALCKSILQLNHVVKPVVKLVNFIRVRGLQHRRFIKFLEETDADHQDLLYHSNIRWLSLGKVCQQVWELKQEIISFLELLEKADDFPELSDTDWLCDLAFAVDILTHMNELNVKLQGKDQFVHEMYTNVRAFKTNLALFSKQMSNKSFAHFPTLATLKEAPRHVKKYRKSLDDLHGELYRRFSDFGKIDKSLWLVSCPFTQDPETAPQELQLELIDLQCNTASAAKFPNIQKMAQRMLVLFGSTYVCDEHLRSVLRIATTKLTPQFDAPAKKGDQQHCSH